MGKGKSSLNNGITQYLWTKRCIRLANLYFPEITIRVDESDCLSAGSAHDQETERFLSTGTTGRRVSFNEAALFDHGKKAQEKGRRSASAYGLRLCAAVRSVRDAIVRH